jgi:hypothetical protein
LWKLEGGCKYPICLLGGGGLFCLTVKDSAILPTHPRIVVATSSCWRGKDF